MTHLKNFLAQLALNMELANLKKNQLKNTKDPNHYHTMTKIKNSLDPKNLLNPGKIII